MLFPTNEEANKAEITISLALDARRPGFQAGGNMGSGVAVCR